MIPIISLEETKAFLRVDSDHEDTLIEGLILTATETAMAHADGLAADGEIPESVRTSALLHVAIDTAANVWPLVPPNTANSTMLESNPNEQKAESAHALPA